jgi:hypothetical protein
MDDARLAVEARAFDHIVVDVVFFLMIEAILGYAIRRHRLEKDSIYDSRYTWEGSTDNQDALHVQVLTPEMLSCSS